MDGEGRTALHVASDAGQEEAVEVLVLRGNAEKGSVVGGSAAGSAVGSRAGSAVSVMSVGGSRFPTGVGRRWKGSVLGGGGGGDARAVSYGGVSSPDAGGDRSVPRIRASTLARSRNYS